MTLQCDISPLKKQRLSHGNRRVRRCTASALAVVLMGLNQVSHAQTTVPGGQVSEGPGILTAVLIAIILGLIVLWFVTKSRLQRRVQDLEHRLDQQNGASDDQSVEANAENAVPTPGDLNAPLRGLPDDPLSPFADHSLPLRVADEIHRMRKRLYYMDEEITGVNALKHSLKRLEEQLNEGGYELVDLAGKKYVDGLNVEARFVPADNDTNAEIITDTIRPQVNYMGVIIQQAKVEVSKSYS